MIHRNTKLPNKNGGFSIATSLPEGTSEEMCISRAEYLEHGPGLSDLADLRSSVPLSRFIWNMGTYLGRQSFTKNVFDKKYDLIFCTLYKSIIMHSMNYKSIYRYVFISTYNL